MSEKRDKAVLIVCEEAFQQGLIGGMSRLFHLTDAFRKLGFRVGLLARRRTNPQEQIELDQQFPGLVLRTAHTGAYPRIIDIAPLLRRGWRAIWKARSSDYYLTQLSCGWGEALNVTYVLKRLVAHTFEPTLIWGTSGGYLGGAVAAVRIAEKLCVPWIIDLWDPPWGCGIGQKRSAICAKFARLLKGSALQVVVTESYRLKLIKESSLDPDTVRTICFTFEGDPVEHDITSLQDRKWHVVYTGSLQGGRSLRPLFLGLKKAIVYEPKLGDSISIEIVGVGLDETKRLIKKLSIQKFVHVHGYLSPAQAEELSKFGDLLVVVQTPEASKFQVPGKIYFECMRFSKPTLAIMPPECEAAAILNRSGLGFIHSPNDIDGIAETLIKLWSDWRTGRSSVQMDYHYVEQFSTKQLPGKLRLLLEKLK